ncbi:hypothetical protein TSAR_010273 [Trichomalopsis sarcophagae]|uniref:Uncharacterized protein n=1 Tax=Trichomalopsis sarcophagae TaxID=543379 RepID=A0A232EQF5_9HYME|nr:hypothetical protein TSAR_010273 [Trichomalopsis sarcophagae]
MAKGQQRRGFRPDHQAECHDIVPRLRQPSACSPHLRHKEKGSMGRRPDSIIDKVKPRATSQSSSDSATFIDNPGQEESPIVTHSTPTDLDDRLDAQYTHLLA